MERNVESRPTGLNNPVITASAWRELQTLLGITLIAAGLYWMMRAGKIPRSLPV